MAALLTPPETGASTNFKFLPSSKTFGDWSIYDHILKVNCKSIVWKDLRRKEKPKKKEFSRDHHKISTLSTHIEGNYKITLQSAVFPFS